MNKFKIGDKVRVINNNQGYSEDFTGVDVEPNSDGWIDWNGSDNFQPNVNFNDKIEVMFWNGETNNKNTVDYWKWKINSNTGYSIKKYRLVKCEKQPEEIQTKINASDILQQAKDCLVNRASERDKEQERSMKSCVEAFNALTGESLTETEGWIFMVVLKLARSQGGSFKTDDYIDMAAYAALAGESGANND